MQDFRTKEKNQRVGKRKNIGGLENASHQHRSSRRGSEDVPRPSEARRFVQRESGALVRGGAPCGSAVQTVRARHDSGRRGGALGRKVHVPLREAQHVVALPAAGHTEKASDQNQEPETLLWLFLKAFVIMLERLTDGVGFALLFTIRFTGASP